MNHVGACDAIAGNDGLHGEPDLLRAERDGMGSTIWRLTAPIRALRPSVRKSAARRENLLPRSPRSAYCEQEEGQNNHHTGSHENAVKCDRMNLQTVFSYLFHS
jgi:hypothetical protein